MLKYYLFVILLIWPCFRLQAQSESPAVRTLARVQANQILLRWEPSIEPLWTAGIQHGFYVERKTVLRNNIPVSGSTFTRLTAQPIMPASAATWTPYLLPDSVQHQVLYRLVTGQDTAAVQADSNNLVRHETDAERRFFFGLMAAAQSYSAARLAALGYIDTSVQANERYEYRVVLAVPLGGLSIDYPATELIGLVDYTPLPAPMKPKLTFQRYYADVKWLHDSLQSPPYVSYWIERSLDGTSFTRVNDRPFVLLDDSTNLYTYKDEVPRGRKTYYYRIIGKTPFDELKGSPIAIGQSKDTLVFAPRIRNLRLLPDNRVYMSWQFPGDTALNLPNQAGADSLLKSFFISVAANPSAKPVTVQYNISRTDTLAYINNYVGKVPGGSSLYFTIGAVRQDGDTLLSASMFVEPLDTIAPARPTGLKGRIDSNGQVYLSWQPNEESDLLGYKVFRSQRKGEEASTVSDTVLLEHSEFTDQTVLNSLNPTLIYQVKAIDSHYNASDFSVPLELIKPDIVQPTSPLITSDTLQNGQLLLTWALSSSSDVVRQLVLRRETETAPWQLISTLPSTQSTYADASIQPAKSYQYLLLAQDAAGMYSDSASIRRIEVPSSQGASRPLLSAFNAQADADLPGIRLSWSYSGTDISEFQLYRSTGSKSFGLWKMVSGLESSADDGEATASGTYRYKIQAIFKDGSVSNWQSASVTVGNSSTLTPGAVPYVQQTLATQQASVGNPFTYTVPGTVFTDPDQTGIAITILPQGLPNGLSVSGNTLSGTPLQAGTYTITVQGTKPSGYKVATTFSLLVSELPLAVSEVPTLTVTIGQSFSYTLPDWIFGSVAGQTPQVSILSAGLPGGVTANGLGLQGTLSAPGPFTITAQAQNSQGGTASVSWLLIGNRPPQLQTSINSLSGVVGEVLSWTIPSNTFQDIDGSLVDVRIRATGLPAGLSVRQNQLIGVPSTTGIYTLTAIATDNNTASTSTTFQIQVGQAANQPPELTMNPPLIEGLVGDSLNYSLPEGLFFDKDGRIQTIILTGSLPNGITRNGLTLKGIPTQSGSFTLTATATDDRGSSISSPVLLTISGLSIPTISVVLTGSSTICSGSSGLLSATGCLGMLTWSNGSTGTTILVTPTTTTVYSATCAVAGQSIASANTVNITVTPQPSPPVIASATICAGSSATLSSSSCSGSLHWSTGVTSASIQVNPIVTTIYSATCQVGSCVSSPGNATVVVNTQPTASITGNLSICSGQTTTLTGSGGNTYKWSIGVTTASITTNMADVYSVTVTNGTGCSAVANATVITLNPAIASVSVSATAITAGQSVTFIATGCSGTVNWSTGSTGNTLVVSPIVSTSYSATCKLGNCSSSSVSRQIIVNHPPVVQTGIINQTVVANQAYSYTIAANTFSDPDEQALTITATGLAPGLSFTSSTGVLSGVPTTAGSYTITLIATDPGSLSVSTNFVLTVTPATFAIVGVTMVSCQTLSVGQRSITFTPQYVGLNGQPVSFSVASEMAPTTNAGPYTLKLHTNNSTITLSATQSGIASSYVYDWSAACNGTLTPNQAPTVANTISSQTAAVGQSVYFTIPGNTFADDGSVNNLTLSASGLPAGLLFNNSTRTISGAPLSIGTSTITVTASDDGNLTVSTTFVLTVNASSASFSIVGVTMVNCQNTSAVLRSITFSPLYVGLSGQPVTFSVVNELQSTTNTGPYMLKLHIKNPTITLSATQNGITRDFLYNWLAACP